MCLRLLDLMDGYVGSNRSSTARLLTLPKVGNPTPAQIWTSIHLGTAILCASLPTFPPLLSHFVAFCKDAASRVSSLLLTTRTVEKTVSQGDQDDKNSNTYVELNDSVSDRGFLAEATAIRNESWRTESRLKIDRIVVRDTIDVV